MLRRLFDDFLNLIELDDFSNVHAVVGLLEDLELRVIFQFQEVQQLQPQVF